MTANTYDIQELVSRSGVPRRTIYFYVQQGILPPPQGAGLAAHYNEDHLLRLKLIPVLREQGLRLDEIRARFTRMGAEEMRRLVDTHQPAPKSVREPGPGGFPSPVYPPAPGTPGWGEQRYTHYRLPAGIMLIAPENLGGADRQRLQQLLQAASQIFSGSPFVYMSKNNSGGSEPAEEE